MSLAWWYLGAGGVMVGYLCVTYPDFRRLVDVFGVGKTGAVLVSTALVWPLVPVLAVVLRLTRRRWKPIVDRAVRERDWQ